MTHLYSTLARVYHEMYQSIFNYNSDFLFYNKTLKKYKCKKILEIGCGSGNLAKFFLNSGYDYTGLDLFNEMLIIARKVEPRARFVQGDMRNFRLRGKFDAIIITGRSFTYLITNEDVMNTLKSIHKNLKNNGILIFDNFDAENIIELKRKKFVQTSEYNGTRYKRLSEKFPNLKTGWTQNWNSTYIIRKDGKTKTIKDTSIVRAFTQDELELFLKLNNFLVLKNSKQDFSIQTIARKI